MNTPWAGDVALSLSRLMEETWYPSHAGLNSIFGKLAINSPEIDSNGSSVNKVNRLREAFEQSDSRGQAPLVGLVRAVVEEMRFRRVFLDPDDRAYEFIEALRSSLARAGARLTEDGRLESLDMGPAVEAGGRETVDRLQHLLRDPLLDPGAILGTSKDLLEATAKHLLKEYDPDAQSNDMPGVVGQAMRVAGLATKPGEIESVNAKAIAALRQQVIKTAEAVTSTRNAGGDGHGHLQPTDVSPQLADYIRNLTLAAVSYMLSETQGPPRPDRKR